MKVVEKNGRGTATLSGPNWQNVGSSILGSLPKYCLCYNISIEIISQIIVVPNIWKSL
jgi:hypothetical protein